MISEKLIMQLSLVALFFAFLLIYVTDGYRLFFKKNLTYQTTRKLAIIRWAVFLIAAGVVFLALIVLTLYLLRV